MFSLLVEELAFLSGYKIVIIIMRYIQHIQLHHKQLLTVVEALEADLAYQVVLVELVGLVAVNGTTIAIMLVV